jgi:hypothetical protein
VLPVSTHQSAKLTRLRSSRGCAAAESAKPASDAKHKILPFDTLTEDCASSGLQQLCPGDPSVTGEEEAGTNHSARTSTVERDSCNTVSQGPSLLAAVWKNAPRSSEMVFGK